MSEDELIEAMAFALLEGFADGGRDRKTVESYVAPMRDVLAVVAPVIRVMALSEAEISTIRLADKYAGLAAGATNEAHRDQLFHRSNALREAATTIRSLHQSKRF
jgi:hypothetical protein